MDAKLERFVADARAASGHTLGCIPGCGKCCLASTVEVGQGGGVSGRARFVAPCGGHATLGGLQWWLVLMEGRCCTYESSQR